MKNILIIRFSSLGDIILTTGVIKYIKTIKPEINIDFFTYATFSDIFNNFPYTRNIFTITKGSNIENVVNTINNMPNYDMVFDLHNNLLSFIAKVIIPSKSITYKKSSFLRRFFVLTKLFKNRLSLHTVERYYEPFKKTLNLKTALIEDLRPYLKKPNSSSDTKRIDKLITIHPFASKICKEWPYTIKLIHLLQDEGIKVRIIGNGILKDTPPNTENLTGLKTLNKLIEIIADSDVFLSTDSGPSHLAVALGIPQVTIFGPTSKELGFYPIFNGCKVIENNNIKCRPCNIHGPNQCKFKHFECMRSIGAEEIRFHLTSLL